MTNSLKDETMEISQEAALDLLEAARLALNLIEQIQEEEGFNSSTSIPAVALRAAIARATGGAS